MQNPPSGANSFGGEISRGEGYASLAVTNLHSYIYIQEFQDHVMRPILFTGFVRARFSYASLGLTSSSVACPVFFKETICAEPTLWGQLLRVGNSQGRGLDHSSNDVACPSRHRLLSNDVLLVSRPARFFKNLYCLASSGNLFLTCMCVYVPR